MTSLFEPACIPARVSGNGPKNGSGIVQLAALRRACIDCVSLLLTWGSTMLDPSVRGHLLIRIEEASGKTQRDLFTWDTSTSAFEAFVKGQLRGA